MKTISFGRCLGIGLGIGAATMALYSITSHAPPSSFQPQQGEFRSLSEVGENPTLIRSSNETQLVQFEENGDGNQIRLPVLNQVTANDLQVDQRLMETPVVNEAATDDSADAQEATDYSFLDEPGFAPEPAAAAEVPARLADIDSIAKVAHEEIWSSGAEQDYSYQIPGTQWQANPFAGEATVHPVDASNVEPTETDMPAHASVDAPAQTEPTQVTASTSQFSADSNAFAVGSSANRFEQPSTASPTSRSEFSSDPYAIAPVKLTISDAVAQRAVHHIEYGKTLARRGASYLARQQFFSALRVIAQAHDVQSGTNQYTQALRQGILALKEAEDFVVDDTETQIGLDVSRVAATHQAQIISMDEAQHLSPVTAMQRYFSVAREQFAFASGENVVSAEALYCLGKLTSVEAMHDPAASRLNLAQSIVYHRSALDSDERHFRSAGELGVLMARSGQLEKAKSLMKQSLMIQPVAQTWENLAKVHSRLGEQELAQLAHSESQLTQQLASESSIHWMGTKNFNASAPVEMHETIARKPGDTKSNDSKKKSPTLGERFKKLF